MEKRRFPRICGNIPVSIINDARLKTASSVCRNISRGGVALEVDLAEPGEKAVWAVQTPGSKIDIEIRLDGNNEGLRASAVVRWIKSGDAPKANRINLGAEFVGLDQYTRNRISSYIDEVLPKTGILLPGIRSFTLLVDDVEVDTGQYEYFPYAEKLVSDPIGTIKRVKQLHRGQIPPDYKEYIFARYCIGGGDLNQKVMESAHRASLSFRKMPISKRKKILEDIHELLFVHKEQLIEILITEGHPLKLAEWEFLGMETAYRQATLNYYGSEIWKEMAKGGRESIYIVRKPDGVVCLIPPRNASASNSLLAAFTYLAGNVLIVKPPLKLPLSTIYLWKKVVWEALKRNNAPTGSLNIIIGRASTLMDQWLESPLVNDIIYFGGSDRGMEVGSKCYFNNKKAVLELSGNDMLLVWEDADIDSAARALLDGFLGSTQICMLPKQALVHENIYERFLEKFVQETKKIKIGPVSDPETFLSPVIKIKDFFIFLNDAKEKGAGVVCGGYRMDHNGIPKERGSYIMPTVIRIDDCAKAGEMLCIKEENFFPMIPVVKVTGKTNEEIFGRMTDMVRENKYGLRCSVWTNSESYIEKFAGEIDNSGLLRINSRHVGFSFYISTHGGRGRTGGPYGEMNYVWQKTSHLQGISVTHPDKQ